MNGKSIITYYTDFTHQEDITGNIYLPLELDISWWGFTYRAIPDDEGIAGEGRLMKKALPSS